MNKLILIHPIFLLYRNKSFGVYDVIEKPGLVCLPSRTVPSTILKPPYDSDTPPPLPKSTVPEIKTSSQVESMRASCALARKTLNFAKETVKVYILYNIMLYIQACLLKHL